MAPVRWMALVAVAVAALCTTPAAAAVKPSDAAATHAYLEAKLAENHAVAATSAAGLKAMEALATQLTSECPGVLAGAPLHTKSKPVNQSALDINQEIVLAAVGAAEHVEHPALARFERTVLRQRWSNRRLTHLVHSFAVEQAVQSGVVPPNVCADLRAWVASGYTTVSAGTRRFLHQREVISGITLIEAEPHEQFTFNVDLIIAHRLKPYENGADRVLARKLRHREGKLTAPRLRLFFEALGRVYLAVERPAGVP